jgi:sulfate transport system ATP-binding protein
VFIELENICKSFGSYKASDEVSFGLKEGALGALLGPSGSGKTTILKMIAGLEIPDSGDIRLDGARVNNVHPSKRGIGFVFQNYALFRYMTVFDNIAFGLKTRKTARAEVKRRVEELLSLIGLSGFEKRYPSQLSGGQKQRVAFARALAWNPRLLLLDEPFAAIDAKVRKELRSWLRSMISALKITSIFVTHDQAEAIEVADRIIITNHGRVEQTGSPIELYREPATPFVASFLGESMIVEDYGRLLGFEGAPPNSRGALRPEFIQIYGPGEKIQYENSVEEATVVSLAFRGACVEAVIDLHGFQLSSGYSLEKPSISVGGKVKVLIYRLYAFEGDKATLVNNSRLEAHGNGYSFAI